MIADDLTGACDAGVQFVDRGISCSVSIEPRSLPETNSEVIVLTTSSRHDPPAEARAKVDQTCRFVREHGVTRIYKKIDSTLQGNLVAEIDAAMSACDAPFAIFAPAFPEMGRTVVDARLQVAGSETIVDIAALLGEQGASSVVPVKPGDLGTLAIPSGAYAIVDARSRGDLTRTARAALTMNPAPLIVGSAALAREVAAYMGPAARPRAPRVPSAVPGPVILCIGSTNPVTLKQMHLLATSRGAVVAPLGGDRGRTALEKGLHLVAPILSSAAGDPLLAALARLLPEQGVRGLVLSGGDTALLVCRALGAHGICLKGQIVLGIPWGTLIGGRAHGFPVATKAGGFGAPDALVRAADFLSRQREYVNEH